MAYDFGYGRRFAPYVPVWVRQERAQKKIEQLRKRGQPVSPVVIEGRKIATTFWGKAWCHHLETFSDYANRLPRGRTYARNGSVVDLQIETGRLEALVSGSELYTVRVKIRPLAADRWRRLVDGCAGRIDSVVELLSGKLSDGVMQVLCGVDRGLFPSSDEISLSCSCPDGARLCKHLAAVLYGVGARLDQRPELLFVLRGVDQMDLVNEAGAAAGLGRAAEEASPLDGDALSEIFGIEIEQPKVRPAAQKSKLAPVSKPVITVQELSARGVPRKIILRWLRSGVLMYTRQRGVYLKTRETEKQIAGLGRASL